MLRDILPILLQKVDERRPGAKRRARTNAARTRRVVNARWAGWNSICIHLTHTGMVNHLYPRRHHLLER